MRNQWFEALFHVAEIKTGIEYDKNGEQRLMEVQSVPDEIGITYFRST